MSEKLDTNVEAQCPAIVFKLGKAYYTVSSRHITSIMRLPDYQKLSDVPEYISGLMMFRGDAIPLLDLRVVLGMPSLGQEYLEFVEMLQQRKQDHIHWADELERCIQADEPFTLTTDPHKCAFGKWYDHFETDNNAISFHLNKIDDPHKELHGAALAVQNCSKRCEECTREECLSKVFERVKNQYVPLICGLIDQAGEVFRDSYREMVVVCDIDGKQAGIIIDEVLSVENLQEICDHHEINRFHNTSYVTSIKRSEHFGALILNIDEKSLLELAGSIGKQQLAEVV